MEMDYIKLEQRISKWKNYFTFNNSPEEITDPVVALQAAKLLEKIKQRIGIEYVFLYVQQNAFGTSCTPESADYDPSNAVNIVLGRYDSGFFRDLETRLRKSN